MDDLTFPGMVYGATVRSPSPRGRIAAIRFGDGIPWEQFTIVRSSDLPGTNCISLILDDQPCLADGIVNHAEEPVVLLGHPDRCLVEEARRAVTIEVDPWPAILTLEESLARKQVVWGEDNVFKRFLVEKGDVDQVWGQAGFIIEGEYTTGAQEQLYIENNGMIAVASPLEGVTVWGSMQCPFYIHKALKKVFGLGDDRVRVVQMETGGGFGGKEEYPSMIAAHAALLAWKSGRPVKLVYDRSEDMAATTKRHPSRTRHRTAVRKDGKLLGMDIEFLIDGGAYATLSSVVLSRGTIHAAGPYECPNVRIRSQAMATNTPPHGAFRGFGAPQSIFAVERQMDKVAAVLGLAPEDLRRRNFIRAGQATATGQEIREEVDMAGLLDRAQAASDYRARRDRFARENPGSRVKRGIGLACFCHGAGFTGSGERYLASVAGVEGTAAGRVRVLASSTEIGQGTNTILAQIAAETLGVPYEDIEIAPPDTAGVPNSGPTVASRTCMVVGKLVERAAGELKETLQGAGLLAARYTPGEFGAACAAYVARHGTVKCFAQYEAPPGIYWDDDKYQGDAYGAFAWAVYVAEVSVDTATYQARVEDFVAVQEIGRVVHPVLATGQIQGGIAQGIGYALYENVVWQDGRMGNCQMTNYIIPSALDVPRMRVLFEEKPYAHGPMGAKGIGELPIDGPAPAIVSAVANALGLGLTAIPLTPESLMTGEARMQADGAGIQPAAVANAGGTARATDRAVVRFTVNHAEQTIETWPMKRLLDVLREDLGLTGTKEGCAEGECGACSVILDGRLVNSCLIPVLQADGTEITTIEGIAGPAKLHAVQQAFIECGGAQCGICTPGMVLAAVTLLRDNPHPTETEVRNGMAGNLCRCTGYQSIFESVLRACESGEGAPG